MQIVDSLLATEGTLHLVVLIQRLQTVDSLSVVTLLLLGLALRLQTVDSLSVVTLHLMGQLSSQADVQEVAKKVAIASGRYC